MDSRPRAILICSTCSKENDRPLQRYCADCHAAYMREWRKTHRMNEGQKARDACRSYAAKYKRRGKLVQEPCFCCGDENSQMHHPDHELPLLVVWLCRECHLTWHAFWRFTALRTWNRWLKDARSQNVRHETNLVPNRVPVKPKEVAEAK